MARDTPLTPGSAAALKLEFLGDGTADRAFSEKQLAFGIPSPLLSPKQHKSDLLGTVQKLPDCSAAAMHQ